MRPLTATLTYIETNQLSNAPFYVLFFYPARDPPLFVNTHRDCSSMLPSEGNNERVSPPDKI